MHPECASGYEELLFKNAEISSQVSNSTADSDYSIEEFKEPKQVAIKTSKQSTIMSQP